MSKIDKFIPKHPLNTAVLFLVFNRPDTTKQVFEAIREAKPPRLYIAGDGARQDREGEQEKVKAVREYIMANIDWDCEIKTLFRENNFGCKMSVSGSIDWFFEHEEMGIILEDDCLPSQSFFWYCEELLDKYKDDMRIGQISGDNFQKGIKRGEGDYYFSVYNHIWGWATWKSRWENYDANLTQFQDTKFIDDNFINRQDRSYWKNIFYLMKQQKIDTWDYQWTFCLWKNKQLTIIPNVNLVTNIGFGEEATHTTVINEFANLKSSELVLKNHPKNIVRDYVADEFTAKLMFRKKNILLRIINKVRKICNELQNLWSN